MTVPRIVTGNDDNPNMTMEQKLNEERWRHRHERTYENWARTHLHNTFMNTERQYTPEFLRAYNFTAEQEDARHRALHYDPETYSRLQRQSGILTGNITKDQAIQGELAKIRQANERRVDRIIAYQLWRQSNSQHMPVPLGLVHFDAFVNHGPGHARRFLPESQGDPNRYIDIRDKFYANIPWNSKEGGPGYNRGWRGRRIPALRREVARILAEEARTQTQGTR